MLEFLGNLLSGEGNFQNVATIIFVYLLLLWLAFCAWVYSDAIKRYDNMFLAIVWFVAVLILNFPALIFYFIVRPDKEDENILLIRDSGGATATSTEGGINVPLVNFVGENGVAISFQLKINKSALQEEEISNMKIDVGFDDKQLIQTEKVDTQEVPILEKLQNEPSEVIQTEESAGNSFIKYVDARNAISKFKSASKVTAEKLSQLKGKVKFPQKKKNAYEVEVSMEEASPIQVEEAPKASNKKKKNKKQKYR